MNEILGLVWAGIESELTSRADHRVLRWFWTCGKNGWVSYGQKSVDGRSQWRTGTRETEVRLDGIKEDIGIEQQLYEIIRGKNFALNSLSWKFTEMIMIANQFIPENVFVVRYL